MFRFLCWKCMQIKATNSFDKTMPPCIFTHNILENLQLKHICLNASNQLWKFHGDVF